MHLIQLKYFVAVARNRSFSRAADELRIAQPALTRHVRMLEAELDGALFVRHQRGVEPTELGRMLLERAEFQIRSFDQMREDMLARSVVPSGRLRIGCPPALTRRFLAEPVKEFLRLYPRINVEVRESISDQLARDVFSDSIDLAVASLMSVSAEGHLLVESLFREEIWIFTSRGSPLPRRITPEFLASAPLLAARRGNATRELLEAYASQAGVALRLLVETDSTQLNEDLIESGVGYAVAPKLTLADGQRRNIKGRAIPGLHIERCLIRRKDRPETRAVREFSQLLRTTARAAQAHGATRTAE